MDGRLTAPPPSGPPRRPGSSTPRARRPRHRHRRPRPVLRWLKRGLAVLLLLPLLALAGGAAALWWTLPATQETLRLPGLSAPVQIGFDAAGIPRIAAAIERDAAMALGLLHARDRMFQMEMMRRGATGRLAEIAGGSALRSDRFTRTLGLAQRATADLATLPAETHDLLEAYAEGVNAWIAARGRFVAPEFLLLGAPEPWRPEHSLLWGKVMGLWLSGNWRQELDRARLATLLPPERLAELWPEDTSPGQPGAVIPDQGAALDPGHLVRLAAALPRFPEQGTLPASASNAWAVAARRSASGAPLLASDPHLGFQAPILWYLARIDLADGAMLAGATSPGVPLLVIGRNRHLAWGFTTTHSDTQDVFVERLAGPDAYETPDGPRPFTIREEVIAVRGADPVVLRVRETRHGPVVSDLDADPPRDAVLAVAMANLAAGDTAAAGLHALNRAQSAAEARAAAALITSPSQNLTVADTAGRIALYLTGRTPLRRAGDGTLPAPGWDGGHDWTGWLPFDTLPHVEDPASGALANANNRVAPADHPAFLGRDWFEDWRFRRIGEMLGAAPTHDAAGFAAMQRDTVSLLARDVLAPDGMLRSLPRPAGTAGTALDLLLGWDGDIRAERPEPLILNAFLRQLGRRALAAGGVPAGAWTARSGFLRLVLAPDGRGAPWCDGDCRGLAGRALEEAVAGLAADLGPDPAAWRWGKVHVARFEHPLLRLIPWLADWARLEAATGGDEWTVSRGGVGPNGWAHVHGAGLRLVADLADPDATLASIATGQSGNPLSAHWGDLLAGWRDGRPTRLGRLPEGAGGHLALVP
ncbi:penicillin acylase family protein [Siccirubricoccus deserti]|uniref:Penicillin acylase family protein n=1 Tax=Siccirubricoccus deserti TaxID=2013562 RepID=A0A9X0UF66_9PROT|nr:penicillin acylase family protein [Siccirubricoccus deserti]MBC4017533.1 penicillin acylase family protein [Siccirubricoccus deserti]